MKKSIKLQEILDSITPERHKEIEREMLESEAYGRWLEETNQEQGSVTSISLKILREHGFSPIGITYWMGEETFIFKSQEEIDMVWEAHILGWDGWFYTPEQAKEEGIKWETV